MSDWLTIQEAADHLKVSKPTIYRWMRGGRLTFYKMGNSTRFRRDHVDAIASKRTSQDEAEQTKRKCAVCGNEDFVVGRIRSTGRVYFQPEKTKFFTRTDSFVPTDAIACTACGHINLFADPEKLVRLQPEDS